MRTWPHFSKHLKIIKSEFLCFEKVEMQFPVRAKFWCRAIAHTV